MIFGQMSLGITLSDSLSGSHCNVNSGVILLKTVFTKHFQESTFLKTRTSNVSLEAQLLNRMHFQQSVNIHTYDTQVPYESSNPQ
jgi:hypothetical protein